jgi:REP element-mobilizing transposase RayT
LQTWDYRTPWSYFVTIVTANHRNYFDDIFDEKMQLNQLGNIVNREWLRIAELRKKVELDYYIVMPNHHHGVIILNPTNDELNKINSLVDKLSYNLEHIDVSKSFYSNISPKPNSLSSIIRSFKSAVTKSAKELKFTDFAWQPRFYDRIIRNERELFNIRIYIEQNPLRWDIVKNYPDNFPEL